MKTVDNDTAFPFTVDDNDFTYFGLTKREYFAALVLAGLSPMCIPGNHNTKNNMVKELPEKAVALADALIEELNK